MSDYPPGFFQSVVNVWRDVALAMGISAISGVLAHLQALRKGHPAVFSLVAFLMDIGSAGLVGFFVLMFCLEQHVSPYLTGPIVGLAAHVAPRLIFMGDEWIIALFKKKLGVPDDH